MPPPMDQKLEAMQIVVSETIEFVGRLAEYYETPEEVVAWLRAPHPQLGYETPESRIASGHAMEVNAVLNRLDADGYI